MSEDDGDPDHACRRGEGTTGAVGFAGVRSRVAAGNPLGCGGEDGLATGGREGVGELLYTGNGKACAVLLGEGPRAADRVGEACPFVTAPPVPLDTDDELCDSSPTFLRLVSVFGASLWVWPSFNTSRSDEGREGPNAGDEYRLRDRVALALPTPSHLYTPLGFLDKVFRGEGVDVGGDLALKPYLMPFVLDSIEELSWMGVGCPEENRNGSDLSTAKIIDDKRMVKRLRHTWSTLLEKGNEALNF